MLPHREDSPNYVPQAWAIVPAQKFDLQMVTRPGVSMPTYANKALRLWSLLGGIGKRSRRMMGAVQIRPKFQNADWYDSLHTPTDFGNAIVATLAGAKNISAKIPDFPTVQPQHCWIVIGNPEESAKEANQVFFRKLLRTGKFKLESDAFGYASKKRRASPIIAQIRKLDDGYYPVITALRSNPLDKSSYSDLLKEFMQAVEKYYDNGITVWGGW
jgi:hypothetical protein